MSSPTVSSSASPKQLLSNQDILKDLNAAITHLKSHRNKEVISFLEKLPKEAENLLQDDIFQKALKEKFQEACQNITENEELIVALSAVCSPLSSEDIYPIAKSGNYSLLDCFEKNGGDISGAVFELLRHRQNVPIERLLEGKQNFGRLNPDLLNQNGNTLLIEAVKSGQEALIRTLLRHGANPLILNRKGKSVFDLSKGKPIQLLLYAPQKPHYDCSLPIPFPNASNPPKTAPEEEALSKFLNQSSSGKPYDKFYCLFIKVENIVLALLQGKCFYQQTPESYQASVNTFPRNRIHFWSSAQAQYGIPEKYAPNHTSMETLGFAVIADPQGSVTVSKQRYACHLLPNDYKTENPDTESGFNYSYGGLLRTHGHGKNPQAIFTSFKEHRDRVKLKWKAMPPLGDCQEGISKCNHHLQQLFRSQESNRRKLDAVQDNISSYLTEAESILEHHSSESSKKWEQDQLITNKYSFIAEDLKEAHLYTCNERLLSDWQTAIQRQMAALQQLQERLQEQKPMKSAKLEAEVQSMDTHLKEIKEMIVNRKVTSSATSTLKIYTSSLLIEDIFAPSIESASQIKKAICEQIGSLLWKIPVSINNTLVAYLLEKEFREKVLAQLKREAEMIVQKNLHEQYPSELISMQKLACELALMEETSNILTVIPPITLTPNHSMINEDDVLQKTMEKFLVSYRDGRKLIDQFWLKVSYNKESLKNDLDSILELLIARVLLMDEEIREVENRRYHYPLLEPDNPKKILDEQLFLLITALLINLEKYPQPASSPGYIQKAVEYVQVRLTPALHGTASNPYKLEPFFLSSLLKVVKEIKKIVSVAQEMDGSNDSPFMKLSVSLEGELPEEKMVEEAMAQSFENISTDAPSLILAPIVRGFVSKVKPVRNQMENLHKYFNKQNQEPIDVKKLQNEINIVSEIIDFLNFGDSNSRPSLAKKASIFSADEASVDIQQLKLDFIAERKYMIRSSIEELTKTMKKRSSLEGLNIEQTKSIQRECQECIDNISAYLEVESPSSSSPLSPQTLRNSIEAIRKISEGKLEMSIQKLGPAFEKLNTIDHLNLEIMMEVKDLIEPLKKALGNKKYKKYAGKSDPHVEILCDNLQRNFGFILFDCLNGLIKPLKTVQKSLNVNYYTKLEKMKGMLSLAIRKQSYCVTYGENLNYYLWDGKPFDALIYHTDNEVHIPLTPYGSFEQWQPHPSDDEAVRTKLREINVSFIRNYGTRPKRNLPKLKRKNSQEKTPSPIPSKKLKG